MRLTTRNSVNVYSVPFWRYFLTISRSPWSWHIKYLSTELQAVRGRWLWTNADLFANTFALLFVRLAKSSGVNPSSPKTTSGAGDGPEGCRGITLRRGMVPRTSQKILASLGPHMFLLWYSCSWLWLHYLSTSRQLKQEVKNIKQASHNLPSAHKWLPPKLFFEIILSGNPKNYRN